MVRRQGRQHRTSGAVPAAWWNLYASSTCSQAQAAAFWAGYCSGTRQSAPWRSTPTAAGCSRHGSATDACRSSRSTRTCGSSTAPPGVVASMLWPAGFPASRGPKLASKRGPTIPATCGQKWPESSRRSDPPMSLQRMLPWPHSKNPGETFEGWATESRQLSVSLRQMLARRISASGGGCWLPTPTTAEHKYRLRGDSQASKSLGAMARRNMWPTPTANAGTGAGHQGRQGGLNLQTAVARWPTPISRDWRSGKGYQPGKHAPNLPEVVGGKLNPQWVEWLMGWPIAWTDCEPLATDKCRWPQRPLGTT